MSKHSPYHGPVLFARVSIYLREASEPQTVEELYKVMFVDAKITGGEASRIRYTLKCLCSAGMVDRMPVESAKPHLTKYAYYYVGF